MYIYTYIIHRSCDTLHYNEAFYNDSRLMKLIMTMLESSTEIPEFEMSSDSIKPVYRLNRPLKAISLNGQDWVMIP